MAQQKTSNIRWLEGELKKWVTGGIIDEGRAQTIRDLYPIEASHPWAVILFSGIGAVIVGLGVVLMFAYNWHDMSKAAKLSVIFSSLIISHSVGIWLFLRSSRFAAIGEALTILGSMLFGAGIWLVAQIYHIEEHYPTAFMFWGLGTLALAWTMPSIFQAIMAAILFTIWTSTEAMDFETAMHWSVPLMLSLWVLAYKKRSNVLLSVLIICTGFVLGFISSCPDDTAVFASLFGLTITYVAIGYITPHHGRFPESAKMFSFLGTAAYFVLLYILTFFDVDIFRDVLHTGIYMLYWFVPAAAAIAGWCVVIRLRKTGRIECPFDHFLIPLTLLIFYYQAVYLKLFDQWHLGAILFNLVFLAHTASMMARGCRDVKLLPTIIGSVMLAALAFARYFDLFENLALRGSIFIVVGIILFSQGFFYVRAKRIQDKEAVA